MGFPVRLRVLVAMVMFALVIVIVADRRPDGFRIERSMVVHAPPEKVFERVIDFHRWHEWAPFETKDPAMKRTFDGPQAGVGSIYLWDGNRNVGSGRMQIMENDPPTRISIDVVVYEPIRAHDLTEFILAPEKDATKVTWAISGANSFPAKLFGLFVSVDRIVGNDFDRGLTNLKTLAEAENSVPPTAAAM